MPPGVVVCFLGCHRGFCSHQNIYSHQGTFFECKKGLLLFEMHK